MAAVDTVGLEAKDMYRHVANDPHEDNYFELGSDSGMATEGHAQRQPIAGTSRLNLGTNEVMEV
jgi:hypothetical protein